MYYRTGEDVNDGFGNRIASCREYTLSLIYKYTEIGPVLDVKVSCHHNVYDSRFKSHLHLETTPKFGW